MSTAQVSIELVLAGLLALSAFVLPFLGGREITLDFLQSNALIGVLGAAYLLGVVFDKLADTMLTPMENHLRLEQAAKHLRKKPKFKGKDAFPQNKLEFRLREKQDGRLQWMESLKSRIRTSRELAVLGLPATMGFAIHQRVAENCGDQPCNTQWIFTFVILNLILLIYAVWREAKRPDEDTDNPNKRDLKTDDLDHDPVKRNSQLEHATKQMRSDSIPYYLLMVNSVLGILAADMLGEENSSLILIGAGGLIISLLSLWTSLRITRTYIKFVAREMDNYLTEKSK